MNWLSPIAKKCKELIKELKEYKDVFGCSYVDMPGIDPEVAHHHIPFCLDTKPIKKKLRRIKPDWLLKMKEENTKQINAKFLMVTKYPQWVADIVPVPKKDECIRICMDFRDLCKGSPKDDFPLLHIDSLVDSVTSTPYCPSWV